MQVLLEIKADAAHQRAIAATVVAQAEAIRGTFGSERRAAVLAELSGQYKALRASGKGEEAAELRAWVVSLVSV